MLIYYLLFACLSVLFLLEHSYRSKSTSLLFSFYALIILSALAGLRSSSVGADYGAYRLIFEEFSAFTLVGFHEVISFDYFFEPGFALYISLVKSFSNSYEFFFFVTALTNFFIFYRVSSKLTPLVLSSWLVYFSYMFFTHGLVAIRFGIASVIGLYVVYWLTEKKRGRAVGTTVIAMLFHTSAIALIVPIALSFFKVNRIRLILIISISFAIGLISFGGTLIHYLLPSWLPRADSALRYIQSGQYGESLGFLGFVNLKNLFISFCVLAFWNRCCRVYSHYFSLAIFFIAGACIRLAFHDLGFIIGRLSAVLTLTEIFLVPMMTFVLFKNKVFAWIGVVAFSLLNLIMMLHIRGFTEYESIIFL